MYRSLPSRCSRWLSCAALATGLLGAGPARADDKIDALIQQLKTSDDFRVRTQAALALGVTKEMVALDPLCGALDDGHEAVRGASAAALAKLSKTEGIKCLKTREEKESEAKVKAQISKSIKALEAAAKAAADKADRAEVPANAKWYISVGKVNNKTSRSNDEIEGLIRDSISKKLRSLEGYAVAPKGEKADAAKKVIASKKLKGFEFQVTAEPPSYDGSKLSIAMKLMITTYPGKDIKAASSPKITQEGVRKDDTSTENQLIKLLLEDAVEKFDKSVASM